MRLAAVVLSVTSVLTTIGAAEAAQVRFRGGLTLIQVTNCQHLYVGQTFTSTFRPASSAASPLGDNPAVTSLSHIEPYSGDLYELNGSFVVNQWQAVRASGLSNEIYAYSAAIKIVEQVPAAIGNSTEFVTLKGLIRNASADPGVDGKKCVAAFRASYFRRYEY